MCTEITKIFFFLQYSPDLVIFILEIRQLSYVYMTCLEFNILMDIFCFHDLFIASTARGICSEARINNVSQSWRTEVHLWLTSEGTGTLNQTTVIMEAADSPAKETASWERTKVLQTLSDPKLVWAHFASAKNTQLSSWVCFNCGDQQHTQFQISINKW